MVELCLHFATQFCFWLLIVLCACLQVTRDKLMEQYHEQWPQYNFAQHKGYGTAAHMAALKELGACPIHRRTFAPLKHWIEAGEISCTSSTHS